MNKTELAVKVAEFMGVNENNGACAVNAVLGAISEALAAGEEVNITGFGKFEPVKSEVRVGRNPQTGEPVDIPAKTVVKFRPGKSLKEQVN